MSDKTLPAYFIEENTIYTVKTVCERYTLTVEVVVEMVEEGLIEPTGTTPEDWQFNIKALQRLQKALSLQRDLSINIAGAALALDLLDEIEGLRKRIALLERYLGN